MRKLGLEEFMDYDLAWGDFLAARNWGMREDGTAILVDEGAVGSEYIRTNYDADGHYQEEWNKILELRKQTKTSTAIRKKPQITT